MEGAEEEGEQELLTDRIFAVVLNGIGAVWISFRLFFIGLSEQCPLCLSHTAVDSGEFSLSGEVKSTTERAAAVAVGAVVVSATNGGDVISFPSSKQL